ncbi:RseA family anti-sigma factor, partial [Arthrospira platensis SPKY1]|nr:RseA family anti-sigma factor [Arthrospira platensis SPKY1]
QWGAYCLIGDALRGDRLGSSDFVDRVMARLDEEPTVLAPRLAAGSSARRSVWQSLLPIAASVMGVAAVGLVAATLYSQDERAPTRLVSEAAGVQVAGAPAALRGVQPVAHDPHREYVFAHQGLSGAGPLPAGVQYVRTVSDQRQGLGQ